MQGVATFSGLTVSQASQADILQATASGLTAANTNTINVTVSAPTSSVNALPATETSATFTVSWSGQDYPGGSGIASYSVYVSDDGGPFTAWQQSTTATMATFSGINGYSYGFYSVATDDAGNVQPTPTTAQATTTVQPQPADTPTSSVARLPGIETSTSFLVSWAGQDFPGGAGVASYSIFVSEDGGPFNFWQKSTTATSAIFDGASGHTYGFYSVATDDAGNVQPTPTARRPKPRSMPRS